MNNPYELPVWEHPRDYGGFSPDGDFIIYSRSRDSSILENCNYEGILEELQKINEENEGDSEAVYDFRAGHWAVGWVEYIIVAQNAPEAVQKRAYEILAALSDYPVLDEMEYSQHQYDAICEYWENLDLSWRIYECQKADISIFAARHDGIPREVFDEFSQNGEFN